MTERNYLVKPWISGQNSVTLVIPAKLAKEHELDGKCYVLVESVSKDHVVKEKSIVMRRIDV